MRFDRDHDRDHSNSLPMAEQLPAFVFPVLAYLSSVLPPPLYGIVLVAVTRIFAIAYSALTIATSLLRSNYDAQTLLPPLISLFIAYLALLSLYRTTSWILRLCIWMVKWTVVIGGALTLAGWVLGDEQRREAVDVLLDNLGFKGVISPEDYHTENMGAPTPRRTRPVQPKAKAKAQPKPRAWDSFERHREWNAQAQQDVPSGGGVDVQQIIAGIYDSVKDGWWKVGGEQDSEPLNSGADNSGGRSRARDGKMPGVQ
jgi:hypothetical protein